MQARRPLNILIVTQYFWPENMRINDLAEGMVSKGHRVTVLTGIPNYPEGHVFPAFKKNPEQFAHYDGVDVVRVPMVVRGKRRVTLALNYLSFFISASVIGSFKLRRRDFDAVFVYGVSPIMAAIPAILIGKMKKAPVFVWVLDLWPDSLRAVGVTKNNVVLGVVGKCVSWIYDRTDYLLVQSKAFVENVRRYCKKPIEDARILYFPSWAEDAFSNDCEPSDLLRKDASVFTIVFAGNIGDAQDFPSILQAVERLRTHQLPVRWVIVGDGRAGSWLAQQVAQRGLDNVHLLGRHPLEKMPALFAVADALLVSLKTHDVFAKTIPGKVQAYLASGRPIIAMLDGEGARGIHEAQAGRTCASGDASGLAAIVQEMAGMHKDQREAMGRAGKNFYREHFSRERLFRQLEQHFYDATLRQGPCARSMQT